MTLPIKDLPLFFANNMSEYSSVLKNIMLLLQDEENIYDTLPVQADIVPGAILTTKSKVEKIKNVIETFKRFKLESCNDYFCLLPAGHEILLPQLLFSRTHYTSIKEATKENCTCVGCDEELSNKKFYILFDTEFDIKVFTENVDVKILEEYWKKKARIMALNTETDAAIELDESLNIVDVLCYMKINTSFGVCETCAQNYFYNLTLISLARVASLPELFKQKKSKKKKKKT